MKFGCDLWICFEYGVFVVALWAWRFHMRFDCTVWESFDESELKIPDGEFLA